MIRLCLAELGGAIRDQYLAVRLACWLRVFHAGWEHPDAAVLATLAGLLCPRYTWADEVRSCRHAVAHRWRHFGLVLDTERCEKAPA